MENNIQSKDLQMLCQIEELQQQLSHAEGLRSELKSAKSEICKLQQKIDDNDNNLLKESEKNTRILNELRMSELIVERSPVILFRRVAGDDPRLEYISQNIKQFGYSPKDFFDGVIQYKDIVHPEDQDRVGAEVQTYASTDVEEYTMIYRCVTRAGDIRWVEDQTSVVRDETGHKVHNQGVLVDITERKQVEDALRKSEEKFRRIVETAAEGFVLMDQELKITDFNNAFCTMLGYSPDELIGNTPFELVEDGFRDFILLNKDSILAKEYRQFETALIAKDGHHIPVLIHGSTLRDDSGNIIGNMSFITDMTEHKKALMLAGEVQKSLLPNKKPVVKGLDIAGKNVSCDEIGGDYFDFIWRQESGVGPFSVVVGDISGHGIESALLMTTARAFLRMRASQPGTISEIISAMNRHLANDVLETGRFMTLFYLSLDPDTRSIEWVRAGHDPALLYDPSSDTFEELKGSGVALGVLDDVEYLVNTRAGLTDDQIIAVGTDGIWEAFNPQGEMFGKERLRKLIRSNAKQSASVILNIVYEELKEFTAGRKNEDDITLVIIKATGLSAQ
ncbi:MAG: sigma-B regulation protein RsbU (phosphoserine phosphatase) [Desulforhopalus sp.]|jgi:sigma-B regulation protein RsbU (phosphoserine phosphatase)